MKIAYEMFREKIEAAGAAFFPVMHITSRNFHQTHHRALQKD